MSLKSTQVPGSNHPPKNSKEISQGQEKIQFPILFTTAYVILPQLTPIDRITVLVHEVLSQGPSNPDKTERSASQIGEVIDYVE